MKSETFPLAVPRDLLREIREAAKQTGLSMADVIRQSVKLGLPKLKQTLSRVDLSPIPDSVLEAADCRMTEADLETDRAMGRASISAQKSHRS